MFIRAALPDAVWTVRSPVANNHFDTAHLSTDLRGRSARGGAVTLAGQVTTFVLGLVSTVILARILPPSDFGLLAMVAAFTGFLSMFKDLGLGQAVVQRSLISHEQVSALFWINVGVSAAVAAVAALASPLIAIFYGEPALVGVTAVVASFILVSGLGIQHQALLTRQMRFSAMVAVDIVAQVTAVAAAIAIAFAGGRYWSLVVLAGVKALMQTGLLWALCDWRPSKPARTSGVKALVAFGSNITGFNLINYWARNLDNMLIGWRWGAGPLGLYSKAYSLLMMPLSQVNGPAARVATPALSRLKNEPDRYRSAYRQILAVTTLLTMPLIAFLIVSVDWVVLLVLGSQWRDAAPIFAWLGLAGLLQPVANTTGWLFITQDRTGEMFRWGVIGSTLSMVSFVVGLPFGPVGVAASYALVDVVIKTPLLFFFVGRRGHVRTHELYSILSFPLLLAAAVAGVAYLTREAIVVSEPVLGLTITGSAAGAVTAVLLIALPRGRRTLTDFRRTMSLLRRSPV